MKKIFLLLFLFISVISLSILHAAESSPQFIQGTDTLVVYKDVPGLIPSDKFTIRVCSVATNNEWVQCAVIEKSAVHPSHNHQRTINIKINNKTLISKL